VKNLFNIFERGYIFNKAFEITDVIVAVIVVVMILGLY
jgi:hypothetical protein